MFDLPKRVSFVGSYFFALLYTLGSHDFGMVPRVPPISLCSQSFVHLWLIKHTRIYILASGFQRETNVPYDID